VELAHARVIELGQDARLAQQTDLAFRIEAMLCADDLEGNTSIEGLVQADIDRTHPTLAEHFPNPEVAYGLRWTCPRLVGGHLSIIATGEPAASRRPREGLREPSPSSSAAYSHFTCYTEVGTAGVVWPGIVSTTSCRRALPAAVAIPCAAVGRRCPSSYRSARRNGRRRRGLPLLSKTLARRPVDVARSLQ